MYHAPMAFRFSSSARAVAAALALAVSTPAAASGVEIAPHTATYQLSLERTEPMSGVRAVKGRIEIHVEASCEGWTVQQFVAFNLLSNEDDTLEHLARLKAYESRDGREFVFSSQTWENRALVEHMAGRAEREDDGGVLVSYSEPRQESERLPAGVVFPSRHLVELIERARAGERRATRVVFDGSTEDNPFEVSAYIGREAVSERPSRPRSLAARRMWPVRLAYFKPQAIEPGAEFEMSVELYEHGVAGDMVFDYGDFAMAVTLESLQERESPRNCREM